MQFWPALARMLCGSHSVRSTLVKYCTTTRWPSVISRRRRGCLGTALTSTGQGNKIRFNSPSPRPVLIRCRASQSKAPSTPATMSTQRSTLLPKKATMSNEFIVEYRTFDKVDIFNLFRLCRKDEISFDIVANNGNNVEAMFDFVEATFDVVERMVRLIAFDNVASTLLLVWTGLNWTFEWLCTVYAQLLRSSVAIITFVKICWKVRYIACTDLCLDRFFWATRFLVFFFPFFSFLGRALY